MSQLGPTISAVFTDTTTIQNLNNISQFKQLISQGHIRFHYIPKSFKPTQYISIFIQKSTPNARASLTNILTTLNISQNQKYRIYIAPNTTKYLGYLIKFHNLSKSKSFYIKNICNTKENNIKILFIKKYFGEYFVKNINNDKNNNELNEYKKYLGPILNENELNYFKLINIGLSKNNGNKIKTTTKCDEYKYEYTLCSDEGDDMGNDLEGVNIEIRYKKEKILLDCDKKMDTTINKSIINHANNDKVRKKIMNSGISKKNFEKIRTSRKLTSRYQNTSNENGGRMMDVKGMNVRDALRTMLTEFKRINESDDINKNLDIKIGKYGKNEIKSKLVKYFRTKGIKYNKTDGWLHVTVPEWQCFE